jgi:hypothetical protein
VKKYGNYGRKVSWIWKLNQWDDRIQYPEQQQLISSQKAPLGRILRMCTPKGSLLVAMVLVLLYYICTNTKKKAREKSMRNIDWRHPACLWCHWEFESIIDR